MAIIKLPEAFSETMRELLEEEADEFFSSYERPRTTGLRANGLKLPPDKLPQLAPFARESIPWAVGGYYSEEEDRPGKHPYYHLGLYYVQEPSAMLPAELLDVRPGHRVLDLCAAPGGKTTQLASKLQDQGVLVANDNAPERTKALAKNMELSGIRNAVVLNEEPEKIADVFGAWFDRVLVDAPCSGEGMFRKDEDMARQWERHTVARYSEMQREILAHAARLVALGGRLVYSTCTFSPRENEGTIARFLADHPDFAVVPAELGTSHGISPGRPDWLSGQEAALLTDEKRASLSGAIRIWPHRSRGEGHFAVLLERSGMSFETEIASAMQASSDSQVPPIRRTKAKPDRRKGQVREGDEETGVLDKFETFRVDSLPDWKPPGRLHVRGQSLYAIPDGMPSLEKLQTVRPGWLLGAATKHRFEPSQALAMGLRGNEAQRILSLTAVQPDCLRYLKGETLQPLAGSLPGKGWTLVCIDGFPAGWGRYDGATLKNERLPGWRWV